MQRKSHPGKVTTAADAKSGCAAALALTDVMLYEGGSCFAASFDCAVITVNSIEKTASLCCANYATKNKLPANTVLLSMLASICTPSLFLRQTCIHLLKRS